MEQEIKPIEKKEEVKPKKEVNKQAILSKLKKNKGHSEVRRIKKELYSDKDFTLKAIKLSRFVYGYLPLELKKDREIVMEAVKSGTLLQHVERNFRNDKEVVIEAVRKHPFTLQYADKSLRNDKEVVTVAYKKKKSSLRHASNELKNSVEFLNELRGYNKEEDNKVDKIEK